MTELVGKFRNWRTGETCKVKRVVKDRLVIMRESGEVESMYRAEFDASWKQVKVEGGVNV